METRTMEICVYRYPTEGAAPPIAWEDLVDIQPARRIHDMAAAKSEGDEQRAQEHSPANTDQLRRSFDAGFAAGREAGEREERAAVESELAGRRAELEGERVRQMEMLVKRFAEAQEHYLQAVEHEVVELALAIAARILRREAQMDPLLLTGATRVALGQLSESTEVTLNVPQADLELWQEAIVHLPNLSVRPEVVANQRLRLGDCLLETRMGSVDLGVRAQLSEIERGFFDRVERNTSTSTVERAGSGTEESAGTLVKAETTR